MNVKASANTEYAQNNSENFSTLSTLIKTLIKHQQQ